MNQLFFSSSGHCVVCHLNYLLTSVFFALLFMDLKRNQGLLMYRSIFTKLPSNRTHDGSITGM